MQISEMMTRHIDVDILEEAVRENTKNIIVKSETFWEVIAFLQQLSSLNLPPMHSNVSGKSISIQKLSAELIDKLIEEDS